MKQSFEWLKVSRIAKAADSTYIISFAAPAGADAPRPGQFCMISPAPGSSNVFLPRPFSYFRICGSGEIEILFRTIGRATRWMAGLSPGSAIGVFGPLGGTFNLAPSSDRVILAGGGIGLPPLVFLAHWLVSLDNPPRVDLIYGETSGSRVVDLKALAPAAVSCHVASEDGTTGAQGLVTDLLEPVLQACDTPPVLYACGPKAMLAAIAGMVTPEKVALFEASLEENMACGRGICQGCVVPLERKGEASRYECCCTEGPVFNGFEVKWQ